MFVGTGGTSYAAFAVPPNSVEDGIGWGLQTDAETLIASTTADLAAPATRRDQLALAHRLHCPVQVISAPKDKVTAHADAKALANATGGELVAVRDGGHAPQGRKPVAVNLTLREFIECAFTADSRGLRASSTVG